MAGNVYGIDLGTTYSCIAHVDEHGKPVVLPNSLGKLTTPSVVYFESKDNVVVGESAKEELPINPGMVESTVKRVMGKENWTCEHHGQTYSPQQVSAYILKKLVTDAQAMTIDKITDVVITVPAYFGTSQKEATKQAGELAGLNVLYVIPEPTAAAIDYGIEADDNQTILVYDLGGGTFDITVIRTEKGVIKGLATGGDDQLGGKNWDELICDYIVLEVSEEIGVSVDDINENKEAIMDFMGIAEEIKQGLSTKNTVSKRVVYDGERITIELTREKFDNLTEGPLASSFSLTDQLLERIKEKGFDSVDKILLVGGSTYMPQVIEGIKKRYPYEVIQFDPNQAVAKGAALFGHMCNLDREIKLEVQDILGEKVENIDDVPEDELNRAREKVAEKRGMSLPDLNDLANKKVINVTSRSFGVVVIDSNDKHEKVSNLIFVDDSLPADVTQTFSVYRDGQEGVTIRCIENTLREENIELNPEEEIGQAELRFTKPLPAGSEVEISFHLSDDGLLKVHARDMTTNSEIDSQFNTLCIMKDEEMEEAKSQMLTQTISD